MDDAINAQLDLLTNDESKNVTGVLITDKQGLCIKTSGNAKQESSGIITAIVDIVSKLEPNKPAPELILESESKCCIIHAGRNMNAAVFKNISH